jgi:hypothetical protein
MNEGWVCPKCGRVFAPWVSECKYCGPGMIPLTGFSYPEPPPWPIPHPPSTGDPLPPPQYYEINCM